MAAALHFDLSVHNFGIQEHMPHTAETDARVPARVHVRRTASMHPGEAPGLGVEIDEALAAQYPYEPAYLPVEPEGGRDDARLVRPPDSARHAGPHRDQRPRLTTMTSDYLPGQARLGQPVVRSPRCPDAPNDCEHPMPLGADATH